MPKRRLQVFISSTVLDLKEERNAAVMAVLSAEHIPDGMEFFAAENRAQLESICHQIDQCDAYILLVGTRYGSVETESGKSFTELEYDYVSTKNIPCSPWCSTPNGASEKSAN